MPDAIPYIIRSNEQLNDLIRDLRNAARRSRRNRGGYGVHRHSGGQCVLNIQVCFPVTTTQSATIGGPKP